MPLPECSNTNGSPKTHIPAFEGQTALERAIKGLLTANNDGARFRRDAARMHSDPAHGSLGRRGDIVPDPTEQEQQAIGVQELRRVLKALHQAADAAAGVVVATVVPLSVHDLLVTLLRPRQGSTHTRGALQRRQVSAVKVPTDHPLHWIALGHIDYTGE